MEQESFKLFAENDNYYFDYFYYNFIIHYYYFDFMEGKSLAGSLLKIMNESKVFVNKQETKFDSGKKEKSFFPGTLL